MDLHSLWQIERRVDQHLIRACRKAPAMMIPPGAPALGPWPEKQIGAATAAVPGRSSIVLATTDAQILDGMGELLRGYRVNTIWARGIHEVQTALAEQDVLACFCGFWLVDGTYRDVVRLLKHRRAEVPMIIVCSPECPQEYRDYLAALNIRAFDFICHPYRSMDLERILESVAALRHAPARTAAAAAIQTSDRSVESYGLRRAS
jgi:DNA-binding NtrC family response regulator